MAVIAEPRLNPATAPSGAAERIPQPVPLNTSAIVLNPSPDMRTIGGGDSQGTVGYATSG